MSLPQLAAVPPPPAVPFRLRGHADHKKNEDTSSQPHRGQTKVSNSTSKVSNSIQPPILTTSMKKFQSTSSRAHCQAPAAAGRPLGWSRALQRRDVAREYQQSAATSTEETQRKKRQLRRCQTTTLSSLRPPGGFALTCHAAKCRFSALRSRLGPRRPHTPRPSLQPTTSKQSATAPLLLNPYRHCVKCD